MSWQLLIGLSVSLYSVNGLLHRTIMKDVSSDAYAQAVTFTALNALVFLVILLFRGGFQSFFSWTQLPLFLLVSLLACAVYVLKFKGFKFTGASENSILLTSTQFWTILGAILFLHETLTLNKVFGIAAILFGVVLAKWNKRTLILDKGAIYVLLEAFFIGVCGIINYSIIRNFDVVSYLFYVDVFITSMLIILNPKITGKLSFYFKPKRALNIVTTSINDAVANVFGLMAYQVGRNALQIGPISATGILLTVLLAIVFLKEKDHIPQKIVGSLAAVAGTVILLL